MRSSALGSQGLALKLAELAGVPIGGAATVCARLPHMGTAARALETQVSANTNANRVQSCIQCRRVEWIARGIGFRGTGV